MYHFHNPSKCAVIQDCGYLIPSLRTADIFAVVASTTANTFAVRRLWTGLPWYFWYTDIFDNVIKQLVHASAVLMSRYWALGKFGRHSGGRSCTRMLFEELLPLSCSPNFPRAQCLDIPTQTHELIDNWFHNMQDHVSHRNFNVYSSFFKCTY